MTNTPDPKPTPTPVAPIPQGKAWRPRIVVVQTVYHQLPGQQPYSTNCRYGRWLDTDEQVYTRTLKAGREWLALDFGWVQDAATFVVENKETAYAGMDPNDEQKAEELSKVLEVGVLISVPGKGGGTMWSRAQPEAAWIGFCKIRAGETMRIEPAPGATYGIRAASDGRRCEIVVIPN